MAKKAIIAAFGAAILSPLIFISVKSASAATLYLSPSGGNFLVGHSFSVGVYVATPDTAMNAAQGTISFPSDKLEVLSLSKEGSVINLWVQDPSYSNQNGTINFGGIALNPGFEGASGQILTATFRVKDSGAATINFTNGSVLANDGRGTGILTEMKSATMTLTDVAASPATPQGPLAITTQPAVKASHWYNINAITFKWNLPTDADGVSYALSSDPGYTLPQTSRGAVSSAAFDLSKYKDGIWYFYVSFESGGAWSPPSIRSFGLDRTPPDPFVIVENNDSALSSQGLAFNWAASDRLSGIDHYTVKIGDGEWFDASTIKSGSVYVLPPQSPADQRPLAVRAYDAAGNFQESTATFTIAAVCSSAFSLCAFSEWVAQQSWISLLAILAVIALIYWLGYLFFWRRRLQKVLTEFKDELHFDLRRLERRIDLDMPTEKRDALESEVEHLEQDVQKEIRDIDGAA